jgi:hypothetical protein
MTLPHEEEAAVVWVETFLFKLLDPKKSPRVPTTVRQEARRLLKHYPTRSRIKHLYSLEDKIMKINSIK